jgi:hypothetical protein
MSNRDQARGAARNGTRFPALPALGRGSPVPA